jgi:putative aldouronate transport system permease protein
MINLNKKNKSSRISLNSRRLREFKKNRTLIAMMIPGIIVLFFNSYLPMTGIVMAFQKINYSRLAFLGDWVGFKNFEFFLKTTDAWLITRNTLFYNITFIILGLVTSVFFAIALSELVNRTASNFYQTVMFLPYFMSYIVISYIVFALLGYEKGFVNNSILKILGHAPVNWYMEPKAWPSILTIVDTWKGAGYSSVVYLAAILNVDPSYYEAARIDGASKWQQIKCITLPMIKPMMIILTLLAVGKIFNSDFGLFYNVPMNNGGLYNVTSTIDTYVYRTMTTGAGSNFNMSAAAGLYQSVVGFIFVLITNKIVKTIEKDYALF